MPRAFPLTPPFDPSAPPAGVVTIPFPSDANLNQPWAPNLTDGTRYLLKGNPNKVLQRPIRIVGGGDVVVTDVHVAISADNLGEMIRFSGGSNGRIVHVQNAWLDPNGHQIDAMKTTSGFSNSIVQLKNTRVEQLFGSKTTVHADTLQAAAGIKELWVEDFCVHTAYAGWQLQKEAKLSGSWLPVTAATYSSTNGTYTFTIPNHTFVVGDYVEVELVPDASARYDGGYQVTAVSGSGSTKKITVPSGDRTPPTPASGSFANAHASKMTFGYTVGEPGGLHFNRVQVICEASPLGGSNNPPDAINIMRIGARTAPNTGSNATASHPGEDETPITDTAWNGLFEATDFYATKSPSASDIGKLVQPDTGSATYHVVRPTYSGGVVTWPNWSKVQPGTKVTSGPHPSGHEAVEIIGGVPVAQWTAPTGVAPVISGQTITGSPVVGQTVVASCSVSGSPTPQTTFTWRSGPTTSGPWTVIGSGPSLVVPNSVGSYLSCRIQADNTAGTDTAFPQVGPVTASPKAPVFDVRPVVTGSGLIGDTLNVNNGTVSGDPTITYTYQWIKRTPGSGNAGWSSIPGQTANSYLVDVSLDGLEVTALVYATNSVATTQGQATNTVIVHPPPAIAPANTRVPGLILVAGQAAPRDGVQVKGDDGDWTGTTPFTTTRQWYRAAADGSGATPILAATGSAYTPVGIDVGSTLIYGVTQTNAAGSGPGEVRSPHSAVVLDPAPVTPPQPSVQLGCGTYDVYVLQRGGQVIRHNLDLWTSVKFNRPDGDIGQGEVDLSGLSGEQFAACCDALKDVLPWADEVAFYRRLPIDKQGKLVWVGPVGDPQLDNPGKAMIPAYDLAHWFDARFVHADLSWTQIDAAAVARQIAKDALNPDPSPRITIQSGGVAGFLWSESILASAYVLAADRLRNLAASGLRWYMNKRTFIATGDPDSELVLVDAHFVGKPRIKLLGSSQTTRGVTTGQGVGADAAIVGDARSDQPHIDLYGLIERVRRTDATDATSAQADAAGWVAETDDPVAIVEQGVLSEAAPIQFSDLQPGRRVRLKLADTCYQIDGHYRLQNIDVSTASGKEVITVSFTPVGPALS